MKENFVKKSPLKRVFYMKRDITTSFKNNTASGYKLSSIAPVVRDK